MKTMQKCTGGKSVVNRYNRIKYKVMCVRCAAMRSALNDRITTLEWAAERLVAGKRQHVTVLSRIIMP